MLMIKRMDPNAWLPSGPAQVHYVGGFNLDGEESHGSKPWDFGLPHECHLIRVEGNPDDTPVLIVHHGDRAPLHPSMPTKRFLQWMASLAVLPRFHYAVIDDQLRACVALHSARPLTDSERREALELADWEGVVD